MTKRVVDYDPLNRITTYFDYDPLNDVTQISREQDVNPVLELNKTLWNSDEYTKRGMKEEFWHYAQIPVLLIEKWRIEEGLDVFNKNHSKRLFQKLNDPQYRYLKTTPKHHTPREL